MYKIKFLESGRFYWADRPEAADGTIMTSAHIAGYTINVYQDDVEIHADAGGPTPPFATYAAPVNDGFWSADDIGYTTLLLIDPQSWDTPPAGGSKCHIRIEYTTSYIVAPGTTADPIVTQIDATVVADRKYLSGVTVIEP